tara:strand:+ start:1291 stop:1479 length:189 start_codon:yes stop_codon:yes gene_type:complete
LSREGANEEPNGGGDPTTLKALFFWIAILDVFCIASIYITSSRAAGGAAEEEEKPNGRREEA